MAEEKKVELDAKTQDPQFKYHLTQKYMLEYVEARGTVEDRIWYYKLVLDSKKAVTRGGKTFDTLDLAKVRDAFADRFFKGLGQKKSKKPSYFEDIEKRLKELEAKTKKK